MQNMNGSNRAGRCKWRTAALAWALAAFLPLQALASPLSLQCGGIGKLESEAMLADQERHALTLLFTTAGGHYVAGVDTKVGDPLEDVGAHEASCGPVAHVDVAEAGRYRVHATLDGVSREEWVELEPQGGARLVLSWPD